MSEVGGKDIVEVIAAGREKLASVPSGGGGAVAVAAAPGGGGSAAPAAEAKKEEKEEEKEESDDVSIFCTSSIYSSSLFSVIVIVALNIVMNLWYGHYNILMPFIAILIDFKLVVGYRVNYNCAAYSVMGWF